MVVAERERSGAREAVEVSAAVRALDGQPARPDRHDRQGPRIGACRGLASGLTPEDPLVGGPAVRPAHRGGRSGEVGSRDGRAGDGRAADRRPGARRAAGRRPGARRPGVRRSGIEGSVGASSGGTPRRGLLGYWLGHGHASPCPPARRRRAHTTALIATNTGRPRWLRVVTGMTVATPTSARARVLHALPAVPLLAGSVRGLWRNSCHSVGSPPRRPHIVWWHHTWP